MPKLPPPDPPMTDADAARYIADVQAQLRKLARGRPALRTLAYLCDMARLEAERQAGARPEPVRRWPMEG